MGLLAVMVPIESVPPVPPFVPPFELCVELQALTSSNAPARTAAWRSGRRTPVRSAVLVVRGEPCKVKPPKWPWRAGARISVSKPD
ncbi:hypothetical protein GCM10010442_03910 [Kitasatospora kifunensis]